MKALLVYGTKHGSTEMIVKEISSVLETEGFEVQTIESKEMIDNVAQYDLVVIGSALYLGSWLKGPSEFVRQNQGVLKARPVWLFSSGLRSDDPRSLSPKPISEFRDAIRPREHRFFSGSLDLRRLSWLHRVLIQLPGVRALFPIGDFRDWDDIRNWAREIAQTPILSNRNDAMVY